MYILRKHAAEVIMLISWVNYSAATDKRAAVQVAIRLYIPTIHNNNIYETFAVPET